MGFSHTDFYYGASKSFFVPLLPAGRTFWCWKGIKIASYTSGLCSGCPRPLRRGRDLPQSKLECQYVQVSLSRTRSPQLGESCAFIMGGGTVLHFITGTLPSYQGVLNFIMAALHFIIIKDPPCYYEESSVHYLWRRGFLHSSACQILVKKRD